MAATIKTTKNISELKKESEKASNDQLDDIFNQISHLGSGTTPSSPKTEAVNEPEDADEEPVIRYEKRTPAAASKTKEEKPGYISLVIPKSLKQKWKTYSLKHGMSLTDSIKLGMKLLEEMEQQEMLKIEDGILTMLN